MRAGISQLALNGFLVLALTGPAFGAQNNLQSAGNPQFEIVGLHGRSVNYVDDLSRQVVMVAERYLNRRNLQFPQRILISLKPAEYVDFEGDYTVRIKERGFVNLDLRWEASLSLLTTCRAISEALLVRHSILIYGRVGADFLPKWPATSIGTKAYLSLRPAQASQLADWLDAEATPRIEDLLRRNWAERMEDFNGYALLAAMEQSGIERKKVRSLMARSISGENISEALAPLIQPDDSDAESLQVNGWWRAAFSSLLIPAAESMETMEDSRAWIEALSDFSNTEYKAFNLSQLWDERENKGLRQLIEARYEILRLRIIRVNPAYFNAARSLGALFETYLSGEKRHQYVHQLTGFLGDFEDSKELEEAVVEALNKGEDTSR